MCAACTIPLISTSAMQKTPSTEAQLNRGLEKTERILLLRL
jgi:hypothetical protein